MPVDIRPEILSPGSLPRIADPKLIVPLTQNLVNVRVLQLVPNETQRRLQQHKAVLEFMGVGDLSSLGKLTWAEGLKVSPQAGVTVPRADLLGAESLFQLAYRFEKAGANGRLVPDNGKVRYLQTLAQPQKAPLPGVHPFAATLNIIPVDTAYWAAQWIDIPRNTVILLKDGIKSLVLLCEKLTVGDNVTFTWERSRKAIPPKPGNGQRPATPATPPISATIDKPPPAPAGVPGAPGNRGLVGDSAPDFEVWTLQLTGTPAFDLRGQDGTQGGPGGDGGNGANGAPGKPSTNNLGLFCSSGPGFGGNGGRGGRAGDGGPGGDGGNGGKLFLFAPQDILQQYTRSFFISVDAGSGGAGGMPGVPGAGGAGGPVGVLVNGCDNHEHRVAGDMGAQGEPGVQSSSGNPGGRGAISMEAITPGDFRQALEKPAIISVSPRPVKKGDTVYVHGLRFTPSDVALLDGVRCRTQVVSDTLLSFEVPLATGGSRRVEVQQQDGTLSNPDSVMVLPVVAGALPAGKLEPGTVVTLGGSGFAPGVRVRVNDQDMPEVQYIDPATLRFKLVRPAQVTQNKTGEPVSLQVLLKEGTASNTVPLVLGTFRIAVFGDSVVWGQGLETAQKFHAAAEQAIRARRHDIGIYKDVFAHSGATIGMRDNTTMPALPGEVPTSYPTIKQQVGAFTDDRDNVDLVLINGGANDIGITRIIDPLVVSDQGLLDEVNQFCLKDMKTLLKSMVGPGGFPNARLIVSGYYQAVSEQSASPLLDLFLVGIGGAVGLLARVGLSIIAARCMLFADAANAKLRQAVNEVNAEQGGTPRIFFADPSFGPQNAVFAPQAFIFGLEIGEGGLMGPDDLDSVAASRALSCEAAGPGRTDQTICKVASLGHPNPKGAVAYSRAILPLL